VIVQSNSKDGGYLDERIENFILGYRSTLESISADDMQNNIQVIISYIYIFLLFIQSPKYIINIVSWDYNSDIRILNYNNITHISCSTLYIIGCYRNPSRKTKKSEK
jgi:hypothetical protein